MPRYFFHYDDGEEFCTDTLGCEFDSLDRAKDHAEHAARDILMDAIEAREHVGDERIIVADDAGTEVYQHRVKDALLEK